MTWVKVCGITTVEARDAAVEAGADALGFVLVEGSPRRVDVATAAAMIRDTPIPTYVLVDEPDPSLAFVVVEASGATGIQPYGPTAAAAAAMGLARGYDVLFPIPVPVDGLDGEPLVPDGAMPLFDTAAPDRHGGTGRTFDWSSLDGVGGPFVLAGGLGPDNVAAAIEAVRPWGVDASSRLESVPGVKDPDTIRAFVARAKTAE
jgi:phosphoribosylanthranilate isomerase